MKKNLNKDTTIILLKAGVAAIPFVGGSIISVWSDLQEKQIQEKIERLYSITESFKTEMVHIEAKVNEAFTTSSDFTDVVETTLRHIVNERKEEKESCLRIFF